MNAETNQKWQEICVRWSIDGYTSLSPVEQTWLNVRSLIDSIENGGLISYFYNSGADTIDDCLNALQMLNADVILSQVKSVSDLFPTGELRSVESRNVVINSWPDSDPTVDAVLENVDDILMPLMEVLEGDLHEYLCRNGLAC